MVETSQARPMSRWHRLKISPEIDPAHERCRSPPSGPCGGCRFSLSAQHSTAGRDQISHEYPMRKPPVFKHGNGISVNGTGVFRRKNHRTKLYKWWVPCLIAGGYVE